MQKNNQYVGVDEQYIPDEEKNTQNNLDNEIKNDINNIYKGAKEYVSDGDNQEKMKKMGRKGLKIAKGIGIGYLAFAGIVIIMVVIIFSNFFKFNKQSDELQNKATNIINEGINEIEKGKNDINIDNFNSSIERYSGTKYGSQVVILLDNIVTQIKKNTDHSITVIYDTKTVSNPEEIIALKKQLDMMTQYEISLDYDSNGFINKVTITNY